MQTLTLTCDRCKKTDTVESGKGHTSKLELHSVGIIAHGYGSHGYHTEFKTPKQEWCKECRTEIGLVYKNDEQLKARPNPSTEEQLVEFLRNFVQENAPQPQQ